MIISHVSSQSVPNMKNYMKMEYVTYQKNRAKITKDLLIVNALDTVISSIQMQL